MQYASHFQSSLDKYKNQEMENHSMLMDYHQNHRSNMLDISAIVKMLSRPNSYYMHAINHYSRIELLECLIDGLTTNVDLADVSLHLVTFVPERFLYPLNEAGTFQPASLKKVVSHYMKGQNYLGMIEPAYYPNAKHPVAQSKEMVHWHAHLIVWGASEVQLQAIERSVARKHSSFFPGCQAFHFKDARSEDLQKILAYICKSPRNQYSTFTPDVVKVDHLTGEIIEELRQRKQVLRKRQMAQLALALRDMNLDALTLGGGEGSNIVKTVQKQVLKRYNSR